MKQNFNSLLLQKYVFSLKTSEPMVQLQSNLTENEITKIEIFFTFYENKRMADRVSLSYQYSL